MESLHSAPPHLRKTQPSKIYSSSSSSFSKHSRVHDKKYFVSKRNYGDLAKKAIPAFRILTSSSSSSSSPGSVALSLNFSHVSLTSPAGFGFNEKECEGAWWSSWPCSQGCWNPKRTAPSCLKRWKTQSQAIVPNASPTFSPNLFVSMKLINPSFKDWTMKSSQRDKKWHQETTEINSGNNFLYTVPGTYAPPPPMLRRWAARADVINRLAPFARNIFEPCANIAVNPLSSLLN